jgi:hypothetical protein
VHEGIDSCLVIRGFDSTYEAQYKQLTVSYPTQKSGELQCLPLVVLEEISSCSNLEHDPFHPVIYQVTYPNVSTEVMGQIANGRH